MWVSGLQGAEAVILVWSYSALSVVRFSSVPHKYQSFLTCYTAGWTPFNRDLTTPTCKPQAWDHLHTHVSQTGSASCLGGMMQRHGWSPRWCMGTLPGGEFAMALYMFRSQTISVSTCCCGKMVHQGIPPVWRDARIHRRQTLNEQECISCLCHDWHRIQRRGQ